MNTQKNHPACIWIIATALIALTGTLAIAEPPDGRFPEIVLQARTHGAEAIAALGDDLPAVAAWYRTDERMLARLLRTDEDLWVSSDGRLFYICDGVEAVDQAEQATDGQTVASALMPLSETFALHSSPGNSKVIYLDFDGHTTSGTYWNSSYNNGADITSQPYDLDDNPGSFSDAERERIQYIWQRVVEDYLPFDVDVTTEDPGAAALIRSSSSDQNYGIRVVISPSSSWFGSAGGVAYIGSFSWSTDTPCFVFVNHLGNGHEKYTAEATSHEVGHTLGLYHDGLNDGTAYYRGHGNWAPIMGVGYYEDIVQWSKGEYASANNTEDDLVKMRGYGFDYRIDDHGDSPATATDVSGDGIIAVGGIIEQNTDTDVFTFLAGEGTVSIDANPAERSPNLDIGLELRDGSGALIASSNPTQLYASISTSIAQGQYYVYITGVAAVSGDYSDYASLGEYLITGTYPQPVTADFQVTPSQPVTITGPQGQSVETTEKTYTLTNNGAGTVDWVASTSAGWLTLSATSGTLNTGAHVDVVASIVGSDQLSAGVHSGIITFDDRAGTVHQRTITLELYLDQTINELATGDLAVEGMVIGDYTDTYPGSGSAQSITEHASGKNKNARHSLEHKWTFDVEPSDTVTFYLDAQSSTSGSENFQFYYSTDNVNYSYMLTVDGTRPAAPRQYILPSSANGTVYVRVTDTDGSRGELDADTIDIYGMYITCRRTILPDSDPPARPVGLAVTGEEEVVSLQWSANSEPDMAGYNIYRRIGLDAFARLNSALISTTSYLDTQVQVGQTYDYMVRAVDNSGNESLDSETVQATVVQSRTLTIHVTDLDDSSTVGARGRWNAAVTVTVFDASGIAAPDVTVSGIWSNGANGGGSAITDSSGRCTIEKPNVKSNVTSVTFAITDLSGTGYEYSALDNDDPEGDSNGTVITVARP